MIRNVIILVHSNPYSSNIYFSQKLMEAFFRQRIDAIIYDRGSGAKSKTKNFWPDDPLSFSCSFGANASVETMKPFWEKVPKPHLNMLIDPVFLYTVLLSHPLFLVSCVDRLECEYGRRMGLQGGFFLPHAVEPELKPADNQQRLYDVVFAGTCYDYELFRETLTRFRPEERQVIESAIEIAAADPMLPYWAALSKAIQEIKPNIPFFPMIQAYECIDFYFRGLDRVGLIRSIKDAAVHVFGSPGSHYIKGSRGWEYYLKDQPNVVLHPAVNYPEALQIQKQSKICLNSAPMFKAGSHERILTSLACGAVPITTDNPWVRDSFKHEEELFVYTPYKYEHVNDVVNDLLAHEDKRRAIAAKGREKVMREHTWDNRVQTLIEVMPPLLEMIEKKLWPGKGARPSSNEN